MRLEGFDPQTGSFRYICTDDGAPAMTFYKLGDHGTYFQVVVGGEGSVNIDAKTLDQRGDVDIGLWPQGNAGVYVQSETRPNWIKVTPSDVGAPIQVQTGGTPYDHHVGVAVALQSSASLNERPESDSYEVLCHRVVALERRIAFLERGPQNLLARLRGMWKRPGIEG